MAMTLFEKHIRNQNHSIEKVLRQPIRTTSYVKLDLHLLRSVSYEMSKLHTAYCMFALALALAKIRTSPDNVTLTNTLACYMFFSFKASAL